MPYMYWMMMRMASTSYRFMLLENMISSRMAWATPRPF